MTYVDGFVIPIPKKNVKSYQKMAALGGNIWMKHGALQYFECIGDDLSVQTDPTKKGKANLFAKHLNLKPSETVIFSWIVYKNKAHRDAVNKKVMADPAMAPENWKGKKMPFDMKKMMYGGFKPIVQH